MALRKVLVLACLVFVTLATPDTNPTKFAAEEAAVSASEAKFMAVLDTPPAVPGSNASSSEGVPESVVDSTSAAMEAAITDLMLGKTAFGATPMGGSVKKIKNLLVKVMMPKVLAAHNSDQKQLLRLVAEIKTCGSTKSSALRGATAQMVKYRQQSRLHKSCRADEAVKYTSNRNCLNSRRSLHHIKILKCRAFAATSAALGTTKNNRAVVTKAGSESVESYISRISVTVCGRHVHGSKGNVARPGGLGGGLANGILDKYLRAKGDCQRASRAYLSKVKECRRKSHNYRVRKAQCNQFQTLMDGAACKRAVIAKDACESYAECYNSKKRSYRMFEGRVRFEERDRKAEWRGLNRMSCLIGAFADGKVSNKEVDACKKKKVGTNRLTIKYPKVPSLVKCVVPSLYPSTGAYKRAEIAPLPSLAKGKQSAECSGVQEISTKPAAGSPKSCSCRRVTLNGFYSAGPLVKCQKCRDVRRSRDRNSCPSGTKLFSPATRADWKTFLASAAPLRAPHWIIDVTRPQNSCGGCTGNPMNSGNKKQKTWRTSDGSPWWLRSTRYSEPNGDYSANCFLDIWHRPKNENSVTFNDGRCNYHSKSYYCQPMDISMKPRKGSPASCKCSKVALTGSYAAGSLIRCSQCITVYRSTQKSSCPGGMKIFSPRTRGDWRTFIKSAQPLRAPHFIIDVTRPQNGCGGCTKAAMKSTTPQQASWRTSDRSPWWLRSSRYSEPNGDYRANCFLDLWRTPHGSENNIQFNDGNCNYRSRSYYCQPVMAKPKKRRPPPPPPARMLVPWGRLGKGVKEEVFYFGHKIRSFNIRGRRPNTVRRVNNVNYGNTGGRWRGFRQNERFAVRWTGFLVIHRAGVYRLALQSDDGSRLFIDNRLTINNDGLHGYRQRATNRRLVKGQQRIRIHFFENGGHAGCKFLYRGADTSNRNRVVSRNALRYVRQNGFREQIYYNIGGMRKVPSFNRKASVERIVGKVVYGNTNRNWRGYSASQNFAARWTGTLEIRRGGNYRWSLISDDGSKLFLNNRFVVNNDGLHGLRNKEGNSAVKRSVGIRVEFFERGGHAGMVFRYMGGDTKNRMMWVGRYKGITAF